jgi:hypothetical protein
MNKIDRIILPTSPRVGILLILSKFFWLRPIAALGNQWLNSFSHPVILSPPKADPPMAENILSFRFIETGETNRYKD